MGEALPSPRLPVRKRLSRVLQSAEALAKSLVKTAYRDVPTKRALVTSFSILDDGCGRRFFVKAYEHDVEEEFARGIALHAAALQTGAFRAPQPLSLLSSHGLIIWECLEGIVNIRDYLLRHYRRTPHDTDSRQALLRAFGLALAEIHRALPPVQDGKPARLHFDRVALPNRLEDYLRSCLLMDTATVPHGDFSCPNLFVSGEGSRAVPVVIDPTPNRYVFHKEQLGRPCSPCVDCGQLFYSLRCHRVLHGWLKEEIDTYLDFFLAGYGTSSTSRPEPAAVMACAAKIALLYQADADARGQNYSIADWLTRRFRLSSASQLVEAAECASR